MELPTRIDAPAKVNLTLEVYGVRPDGYHDLRSVVECVTLADELVFEPSAVFSTDTGYGENDLVFRAAKALCPSFPSQWRVSVAKRIPVGGGLGGGSADAAAALRALNSLWSLGKTPEELAAVGAAVGSDVPALVLAQHYRRPVMMEGRGERVRVMDESEISPAVRPSRFLVLANPGVGCPTGAVYAGCTSRTAPPSGPVNDLEKPAEEVCPAVADLLARLRAIGLSGARMSGSGSTVFAFATDAAAADAAAAALRERGISAWSCRTLR